MATAAQMAISDQDEDAPVRRCRHCQKDLTGRPPAARYCSEAHRYAYHTARRAKPRDSAVRSLAAADPVLRFCRCDELGGGAILCTEPWVRCVKCGLSPRGQR